MSQRNSLSFITISDSYKGFASQATLLWWHMTLKLSDEHQSSF
jgi:hypothetical protein